MMASKPCGPKLLTPKPEQTSQDCKGMVRKLKSLVTMGDLRGFTKFETRILVATGKITPFDCHVPGILFSFFKHLFKPLYDSDEDLVSM